MVCKNIDSFFSFFVVCKRTMSILDRKKRGILKTLGQPELAVSWVSGAGRERERELAGREGFK